MPRAQKNAYGVIEAPLATSRIILNPGDEELWVLPGKTGQLVMNVIAAVDVEIIFHTVDSVASAGPWFALTEGTHVFNYYSNSNAFTVRAALVTGELQVYLMVNQTFID